MRNYEYNYINLMREKVIPEAHRKHYGTYMSFDDKPISPGCMACKTGRWLCTFIGTKCNLLCPHCPNTTLNSDPDFSSANNLGVVDLDKILEILENPLYTGVAISGGEPMLYIDKLVDWITKIRRKFPDIYIWHYTNGLLASEENLRRVADAGVDEVRFDLAADNYSQKVLDNMAKAVTIIPSVAIEVPVLLEQYNDLIKAIDFADSIGVKYINLHDLFVTDKLYKEGKGGYLRNYDKVSGIQRDVVSSSILIYRAFRHIKDNNLHIVPNDCTLINMQMQWVNGLYKEYYGDNEDSATFDEYMEAIIENIPEDRLLLDMQP